MKIKAILLVAVLCGNESFAADASESSSVVLYELSQEVKGDKAKTNPKSKKEDPEQVDKYLKDDEGYQLYREDIGPSAKKNQFENSLRKVGIVDTARAFGSQAGLHWRYKEINEIIDRYAGRLDSVNFRPFMTDGMILTPSILISKNDENFINDKKMIKTNISFIVDQEARIVSVPPTFRDYIVREFEQPRPVNPLLKPKNEAEQKLWRSALQEGWEIGVEAAFDIFKDGLLQLERDIQGRINYRKMVQLEMISPAALKVSKMGVTFNGRTMNAGETIYEISQDAQYKSMDEWRSAWLKAERLEKVGADHE